MYILIKHLDQQIDLLKHKEYKVQCLITWPNSWQVGMSVWVTLCTQLQIGGLVSYQQIEIHWPDSMPLAHADLRAIRSPIEMKGVSQRVFTFSTLVLDNQAFGKANLCPSLTMHCSRRHLGGITSVSLKNINRDSCIGLNTAYWVLACTSI